MDLESTVSGLWFTVEPSALQSEHILEAPDSHSTTRGMLAILSRQRDLRLKFTSRRRFSFRGVTVVFVRVPKSSDKEGYKRAVTVVKRIDTSFTA